MGHGFVCEATIASYLAGATTRHINQVGCPRRTDEDWKNRHPISEIDNEFRRRMLQFNGLPSAAAMQQYHFVIFMRFNSINKHCNYERTITRQDALNI